MGEVGWKAVLQCKYLFIHLIVLVDVRMYECKLLCSSLLFSLCSSVKVYHPTTGETCGPFW